MMFMVQQRQRRHSHVDAHYAAVCVGEFLTVADHDFTKFGMVPSVILLNDITEEISGSRYHGQVNVSLKDTHGL